MGFSDMIQTLNNYQVFDVLLPFVLVFTIVYAVLHKTKILGEGKKNYNVVVSLAMGLAVVFPHVLYGTRDTTDAVLRNGLVDVVEVMNNALPNVSLVLVAVLMVLVIMGVFGANIRLAGTSMGGWFTLLGIIIVIAIFGSAAGWSFFQWGWLTNMDSDVKNLILIIIVFGVIIAFITSETPTDKKEGFFKNIGDKFQEIIQK